MGYSGMRKGEREGAKECSGEKRGAPLLCCSSSVFMLPFRFPVGNASVEAQTKQTHCSCNYCAHIGAFDTAYSNLV